MVIFLKMSRTDQTFMGFISNMNFMGTRFAILMAIDLFLFMMMKRAPGCQGNGKYPKQY
jgi:hypothetical protein